MSDKVTPITKHKDSKLAAGLAQAMGVTSKPYAGASQAIKDLLDHHGFDESVRDKGWIEVRIIGSFSAIGAVLHTMQARQVQMSEREAPGIEFLKMLATVNKLTNEALLGIATVEEIETLNTAFSGLSQDALLSIAMEDQGAMPDSLPFDPSDTITAIVERFQELIDATEGPASQGIEPGNEESQA